MSVVSPDVLNKLKNNTELLKKWIDELDGLEQ
jgi:hypothetical protein